MYAYRATAQPSNARIIALNLTASAVIAIFSVIQASEVAAAPPAAARPRQMPVTAISLVPPDPAKWTVVSTIGKTRTFRCRDLACPYPVHVFTSVGNSPTRSIDPRGLENAARERLPVGLQRWQSNLDWRSGGTRRVEMLGWRTGRARGFPAIFADYRISGGQTPERFAALTIFYAFNARITVEVISPSRQLSRDTAGAFVAAAGIRERMEPFPQVPVQRVVDR
ncbi:hypothetical protein E8L99_22300 [Phreatobacter aquaticus]|uniref:Uncharacterized protein n=1 Tax=Phreatobacter aquaticus TaxID=2570229 RepID=A0A4D7QM33_9HYPH|nr:hypothetical protein [Phreatobacter aquaticus]QCK88295.1 hypothetical protein E8L99_22300 [Phreatobacter aquaticus]